MVQSEYFQVLIDTKRNDLRAIAHPLPEGLVAPSWRQLLGRRLIQLGRRLQPDIEVEPRASLGVPVSTA